jgi:predicted negative regulator of RcsB-dependent stress response
MTSPFSSSERTENLMDWFSLHSRKVGWIAAGLALLAVGGWFYIRSQDLKSQRAETAYYEAQRSVFSGNYPLAESDLKKVITRYDGTAAADEARLLLAQVLFNQGKHQQGVDELKRADMSDSKNFEASAHLVLAGGLEQLKKFAEAGQEYEKAAAAARFDSDRQRYESLAARAYLSGGDTTKARALWTALGADSKGTVAGEARVRLGELDAKPQPTT